MKKKEKEVIIIGHRGAGKGCHVEGGLENTIASFVYAFKNGAGEIETDLALSKDGVLFLFHDLFVKTDSFQVKKIRDLDSDEIKRHMPQVVTFSEVIEKYPKKKFSLELKDYTDIDKIIDRIYPKIKNNLSQFRFVSFSLKALQKVKNKDSHISCNYIATCIYKRLEPFITEKHISICLENNIEEISGSWLTFRSRMIRKAQEKGLEVGLGMINSKRALRYCLKNNVRRVYTDKVKEISEILRYKSA